MSTQEEQNSGLALRDDMLDAAEAMWGAIYRFSQRHGIEEALPLDMQIPEWDAYGPEEQEIIAQVYCTEMVRFVPRMIAIVRELRMHRLECEDCDHHITAILVREDDEDAW